MRVIPLLEIWRSVVRSRSFQAIVRRGRTGTIVISPQRSTPSGARGSRAASRRRRFSRSGNSVVEVALMAPWIFFLFMGILDVGFYMYAAINAENAARVAVMYTASSSGTVADSTLACTYVLQEVSAMPFPGGRPAACGSLPLQVLAERIAPLDGEPSPPVYASRVTVTLRTIPMIPIPGLMGQYTISRQAIMRVKDDL